MDYDNFAGVRIDGSNATIVGLQPGGFKFDPTDRGCLSHRRPAGLRQLRD